MTLMYCVFLCGLLASVVNGSDQHDHDHDDQAYYTMEQSLALAPVIVSGRDHYHASNGSMGNYTFDVTCIYKNPIGVDIMTQIYLLGVGAGNCSSTEMHQGKDYILGLKVAPAYVLRKYGISAAQAPYYYVMAEVRCNTAAFQVNEYNLDKAAQLCGNDEIVVARGSVNGYPYTCGKKSSDGFCGDGHRTASASFNQALSLCSIGFLAMLSMI